MTYSAGVNTTRCLRLALATIAGTVALSGEVSAQGADRDGAVVEVRKAASRRAPAYAEGARATAEVRVTVVAATPMFGSAGVGEVGASGYCAASVPSASSEQSAAGGEAVAASMAREEARRWSLMLPRCGAAEARGDGMGGGRHAMLVQLGERAEVVRLVY